MNPKFYASAQQIGNAVEIRRDEKRQLSKEDRHVLNQVIHSGDVNPHRKGFNPFADPTFSYDPNVQKELDRITRKYS